MRACPYIADPLLLVPRVPQVATFEFESGAIATLTAVAFTERVCQRHTRIYGTKGELEGDGESKWTLFDLSKRVRTEHEAGAVDASVSTALGGHGGADYHLISQFVDAVGSGDASKILSGPDETLESHLMCFAAEKARRTGTVVDLRGGAGAVAGVSTGAGASASGVGAGSTAARLMALDLSW